MFKVVSLPTVNSVIFARILFLRNFVEIKPSQIDTIILSFTDVSKSCPSRELLTWQICILTFICDNKMFAKISEFIVFKSLLMLALTPNLMPSLILFYRRHDSSNTIERLHVVFNNVTCITCISGHCHIRKNDIYLRTLKAHHPD